MSISKSNLLCLIVGAAVGIAGFSIIAPSNQPLKAAATDRTSKFALASVPCSDIGDAEGIFVLDFLNGTISGGVLNNRTGKYSHRYFRQLGADFKLDANTPEPEFAIVGARADLQGGGVAKGVLHIAEKSSGLVIAYGFNYSNNAPSRVQPLTPLDALQYREGVN